MIYTLFKYVFLTRMVFPLGKTPIVRGIGGSPSFCCRLSATTRNARRPILIRSGVKMIFTGRPTDSKSNTISRIAKSSLSCAINCIIFTKMFSGVSRGTTAFDPLGNKEFTMLCSLLCVAELLSHLILIM